MATSHVMQRLKPMNPGKVSILLPCLNARRFLEERVSSIIDQTYENWEAIILDSFSDDGSWEYFQSIAATDRRFELHRIPRDGLYTALNRGIRLATGEFIHIGTCDDTMHSDFLAETVAVLNSRSDVDIAVTDLEFIDAHGGPLKSQRFGDGLVQCSNPSKLTACNFRPVPHDSFLHLSGNTVYLSLTQLLVRTRLAIRNPFDENCGSIADFEWSLQLSSKSPTIHIPRKLATWRYHGDQLSIHTDATRPQTVKNACTRFTAMYSGPRRETLETLRLPMSMGCYRISHQRFSFKWAVQNLTDAMTVVFVLLKNSISRPRKSFRFILGKRLQWRNRSRWLIEYKLFLNGITPSAMPPPEGHV